MNIASHHSQPLETAGDLIEARDLTMYYGLRRKSWLTALFRDGSEEKGLSAVDNIRFSLKPGEVLGIVGESGSGKSTLLKMLIGQLKPSSGCVFWKGSPLLSRSRSQIAREIQMIFQDPLASLNPRMTAGQIISEPLICNAERELSLSEIEERVAEMMYRVGLLPSLRTRYPHEFSGGQCQRIGIARALISHPKLLICDEPVASLDVSIQAQIINLLKELQEVFGLTIVFVAHDLAVVRQIATKILVMYLGKNVEYAPASAVYEKPLHPYTQALLATIPQFQTTQMTPARMSVIKGEVPASGYGPSSGCRFRTRCPWADAVCAQQAPELLGLGDGHSVACWKAESLSAQGAAIEAEADRLLPHTPSFSSSAVTSVSRDSI